MRPGEGASLGKIRMSRLRVAHVALVRPNFRGDVSSLLAASRSGLERLAGEFGFDLVVPSAGAAVHAFRGEPFPGGVVSEVEDAVAIADALSADPPDLLLLQHVTFATGDLVAPLVQVAPRLAVWATSEGATRSGPLPFNAACGLQMTMSLLDTPAVQAGGGPVKALYGDVNDPAFRDAFATTIAALRGVRAVETATILQIGGTAPGFYALEEHPAALGGARVVERSLDDLFQAFEAAPEAEIAARVEASRAGHDVEVDDATLERSARIEHALETVAREVDATALAVRCWPELPDRCDAMACAAMGSVAGRGTPTACEGDVMGALSMLLLQGVVDGPTILMDLSDLDASRDAMLLWHCGNAPAAWADPNGPRPRLTTHFNRVGVGPVRDETLAAGETTALRFVDEGARAVLASGTLLGSEVEGFDGVRGWWTDARWIDRPMSTRSFFQELLAQRVPHHLAFARGDVRAAVAEACAWLGIDLVPAPDRPFESALGGGAA